MWIWLLATAMAAPANQWSYEGKTGPEKWGELQPEFTLCKSGREQSPVELSMGKSKKLPYIQFSYRASRLKIQNTGSTIKVTPQPGSYIRKEGKRYDLKSIELRSPSEHSRKGRPAEMELQLRHEDASGKIIMVALLLEKGPHHSALQEIWESFPKDHKKHAHSDVIFNALNFLPKDPRFDQYEGSLTTPPCTEKVVWAVMREPVRLSVAQIDRFRTHYKMNARPLQPLNERIVWKN